MGLFSAAAKVIAMCAILIPLAAYLARDLPMIRGGSPLLTPRSSWQYESSRIPSQKGRTVLITGGNVGLGFSSAKHLVRSGANVIIACRNLSKCKAAREKLKVEGDGLISTLLMDLGSLQSIKKAAELFLERNHYLDALMLNAGIMACPYALSSDGIEMQFAVNHVGHYYLTKLLLPVIQRTAASGRQTHIVSLSSSASFRAPAQGVRLNLDSINDQNKYFAPTAYGQSKLSNILFAQELARQVGPPSTNNIVVTAVHPGAVMTELPRYIIERFPKKIQSFLHRLLKFLGQSGVLWSSDTAALTQVFAMTSNTIANNPDKYHGKFLVPIARVSRPPKHAANMTLQESLWEFTDTLVKQKLEQLDKNDFVAAVTKLETVTIAVTRMGCETCEVDVENIINEQSGVVSSRVDYFTGLAEIKVQSVDSVSGAGLDIDKLRLELEYAGYGCETDLSMAETHERKSKEQLMADASANAEARRLQEEAAAAELAAADLDGDDWLD